MLKLRIGSTPLVKKAVHSLCHRFLLSRRRTVVAHAGGFRLVVPPTVFHPRHFATSEFFASFIAGLELAGKRAADLGTGSGILALTAARSGASSVLAVDINPNAARAAAENARANGLAGVVRAICANFLSPVAPGPRFDVIFANPPYFAGEPRDLADRAWHAGPGYRDIAELFTQARERLVPDGRMYVLTSSNSELDLFRRLVNQAGFRARLVTEHSIFVELVPGL